MTRLLDSVFCIYSSLIVCFNEIEKLDETIHCPNHGCVCYNGGNNKFKGNDSYLSLICSNSEELVINDLKNLSTYLHFNTIAFENITTNFFPENSFPEISFRYLILRNISIESMTRSTKSIFANVRNKEQTEALTFLNSNITHWNWTQQFKNFTNIKSFYAENCSLPEVMNFNNWSTNSLISLSLINCKIENISINQFNDWPLLRMVSLAKNSIKVLKRGWFAEDLPKLWSLDLSHNKISEMEPDFFNGMQKLRRLRLDNNQLKHIYLVYYLVSDRNLNEFSIENNNFDCEQFCPYDQQWLNANIPNFFLHGKCNQTKESSNENSTEVDIFNLIDKVCQNKSSYIL